MLFRTLLLLGWIAWPSCLAAGPNVVLIVADDLGYADVGFNGSTEIRTPAIDRIAQQGVRCTSGYAPHSVCSPSRAGIMTGRYQHRFGYERNPIFAPDDPNMGLPRDQKTLARVLREVGYRTAIIGKWHLGAHETLKPNQRGFDYFYGMLGGGHNYFPELLTIDHPKAHHEEYSTRMLRNDERVDETEYLTDAFSREAVAFIERNAERPFFLYLSYNAPHTPMQATKKYLDRYQEIENKKRRTYAAMVSAVDDGVGRVLETLKARALDESTLIFFLSDNGGPTYANTASNKPLRGQKGSMLEGGVRVPFAVRWDSVLPAGIDYDHAVSGLDIFATAIAAAGAEPPAGQSLDGVDLVPYLTGTVDEPPHEYLFWRQPQTVRQGKKRGGYAVRQGNWKLFQKPSGQQELYDLAADIGEKRDVYAEQATRAEQLDKARKQWDSELLPPRFLGLGERKEYEQLRKQRKN